MRGASGWPGRCARGTAPDRRPRARHRHPRSGGTWPRRRAAAAGDGGAVRVRGIGRGEHLDDARPGVVVARGGAFRAQPVDGGGEGELGASQPLYEIAPTDTAPVLHLAQDGIRRGEAAGDLLRGDRVAGHDPVPLEQADHARVAALGLGWRRSTGEGDRRRDGLGDERPASGALGRAHRPGGAEPGSRGRSVPATAGPPQGSQRQEGVVGDGACPDQVPHGVQQLTLRRGAGAARRRRTQHGREDLAIEARSPRLELSDDGAP